MISRLILLFLTSCASQRIDLLTQAKLQGFTHIYLTTSTFTLTGYYKIQDSAQVTHVYIEGDGNSWQSRYQLSHDPTPKYPMALKLALQDNHVNVIYLARPCQYTKPDLLCHAKFWSSHRYAKPVIQATQDALDQLKSALHLQRWILIGFSGGATVALLASLGRQDIAGVVTVAGAINHQALNQHHQTTLLTGSLNPVDYVNELRHINQCHWLGAQDTISIPGVTIDFINLLNSSKVRYQWLRGATHQQGWAKAWPACLDWCLSTWY